MAEQVIKLVLFVCLGNICWSPIAEAVFRKLVTDQNISDNWVIDSGAVSDWNVGRAPDPRAMSCLRNHGIITAHKARQVTKEDFATFDYILYMDESNLRELNRKSNQVKNCRAKIKLLGSYDPQKQLIIEDPYYGNDVDFETVYQQCVRCCRAFLEKVRWPSHPAVAQARPPRPCVKCQQCHLPSQGRSPPFSWLAVSHLTK